MENYVGKAEKRRRGREENCLKQFTKKRVRFSYSDLTNIVSLYYGPAYILDSKQNGENFCFQRTYILVVMYQLRLGCLH